MHGKLSYDPAEGISLELIEDETAGKRLTHDLQSMFDLYGQLVNGSLVTLEDCFITRSPLHGLSRFFREGTGLTSPTTIRVNQAILGKKHVVNLRQMPLRRYSLELSLLSG
jgi:hypothetical protein